MRHMIRVGRMDGRVFAIDAGELVAQTTGVIAAKGRGKTYLAQLLAEGLLDAGAQVIGIDPVAKWFALRLGADGRPRGGKDIFLLGGRRADAPLAPETGRLVAKTLVEQRLSAVLDLTFMRKHQKHKFLADFGEELLHLKQREDSPPPLHAFLEEAQTVLPQMQRHGGPDEMRMLGAWEDIVRLGRNCGIGCTLISQRPQSVNKEALSQVEALFALGVNEVPARKAIDAWVQEKGADREIVGELPGLPVGEAILWSPSWLRVFGRVEIGQKTTFDASATPKLGRRRAVGRLSKVNVKALRRSMEEAVKVAERDDPTALKRKVVELETALAKAAKVVVPKVVVKPAAPPSPSATAAVRLDRRSMRVLEKHLRKAAVLTGRMGKLASRLAVAKSAFTTLTGRLATLTDRAAQSQQVVVTTMGTLKEELHRVRTAPATPPAPARPAPVATKLPLPPALPPLPMIPRRRPTAVPTPDQGNGAEAPALKAGARVMLRVLEGAGDAGLTRSELAVHSILSQTGGTLSDYLSALRARGLIREENGRIYLADGVKPDGGPLRRGPAEIVELWGSSGKLKAGARRMLDALMQRYPDVVPREELATLSEVSATGGTMSDYLSALNASGLIEKQRGGACANPALYLYKE